MPSRWRHRHRHRHRRRRRRQKEPTKEPPLCLPCFATAHVSKCRQGWADTAELGRSMYQASTMCDTSYLPQTTLHPQTSHPTFKTLIWPRRIIARRLIARSGLAPRGVGRLATARSRKVRLPPRCGEPLASEIPRRQQRVGERGKWEVDGGRRRSLAESASMDTPPTKTNCRGSLSSARRSKAAAFCFFFLPLLPWASSG
ncbi:hypothetical protein LX36DRAFT_251714 [Colletotrichum falcatum]|nr:hypothetical protein LX36DRAFT_251714 [Colletotrichum falcatum]